MRRGSAPALADQPLPELPLPDGISTWTASAIDDMKRGLILTKSEEESSFVKDLCRTIDILGARSQHAQGVNAPITSVSRLHENNTYKLFLLTHEKRGLGILKVGVKKLFVSHPKTKALIECDPLCILDFYVGEESQRRGFGKQLFVFAIESEGVARPETLAIDGPSPKFLAFLKKHYGLEAFTPQVNNFVVFHRFFEQTTITERGRLRRTDGPAFNADANAVGSQSGVRGHLKGSPGVLPQQSTNRATAAASGRHSLGPIQPLPTSSHSQSPATPSTAAAVSAAAIPSSGFMANGALNVLPSSTGNGAVHSSVGGGGYTPRPIPLSLPPQGLPSTAGATPVPSTSVGSGMALPGPPPVSSVSFQSTGGSPVSGASGPFIKPLPPSLLPSTAVNRISSGSNGNNNNGTSLQSPVHAYRVEVVQANLSDAPYLTFREDVNTPRRSGALAPIAQCGGIAQSNCAPPPPPPASSQLRDPLDSENIVAAGVRSGGGNLRSLHSASLNRSCGTYDSSGAARRLPLLPSDVAASQNIFNGYPSGNPGRRS